MRVFDCKSPVCKSIVENAPTIFNSVCDDCKEHFKKVTDILDNVGISYKIDKAIVRGLDYYSKTVFEFVTQNIGAQGTVLGGGRYDGLISDIGGNDAAGIGFAMGLERLVLLLSQCDSFPVKPNTPDIMLIPIGDEAKKTAYKLLYSLRKNNIAAEIDINERSVKAQMKYADKISAKYTVVIGDDEVNNDKYTLKNMQNGETCELNLAGISKYMEEMK